MDRQAQNCKPYRTGQNFGDSNSWNLDSVELEMAKGNYYSTFLKNTWQLTNNCENIPVKVHNRLRPEAFNIFRFLLVFNIFSFLIEDRKRPKIVTPVTANENLRCLFYSLTCLASAKWFKLPLGDGKWLVSLLRSFLSISLPFRPRKDVTSNMFPIK